MARPRKKVDLDKLHNLALIGASHRVIATELGISHDTLTRRYHDEIEKGRGEAQTRILAKIFQSAVVHGNIKCLLISAINRCGWSLTRPDTTVVNVVQNAAPQRSPEQTKQLLIDLQLAVRQEARRLEAEQQQLPP